MLAPGASGSCPSLIPLRRDGESMTKIACRILVCLSTVGLILPYGSFASAANLKNTVSAVTAGPLDIALTEGMLRGQLLDGQGSPRSDVPVTVSTRDRVVQRTASDAQGKFAVPLDQGGVYVLAAGGTSTLVRAWTKAAAPPTAKDAVLLVSGQDVQRGKGDYRDWWGNPYVRTGVAVAAIAGIATAIVLAVDDDDDAS